MNRNESDKISHGVQRVAGSNPAVPTNQKYEKGQSFGIGLFCFQKTSRQNATYKVMNKPAKP
jgi:hypothetical protein